MENNITKDLIKRLKSDEDLRFVWKSNIAVKFYAAYHNFKDNSGKLILDSNDIHNISNEAAEIFLNRLCFGPDLYKILF